MLFSLWVAPTVGPGGPWIATSPFGLLAMTVGMAHGLAALQRLRRAIMGENGGGGAGRFVGALTTGDRVRPT